MMAALRIGVLVGALAAFACSSPSRPPEHPPVARAAAPVQPTWTVLYARYFGPNSEGACGRSRACHSEAVTDAGSAYSWLLERGYIAGTQSPLVSTTNSCLRWFGGNMPPDGKSNEEAARDLAEWVAAGAKEN